MKNGAAWIGIAAAAGVPGIAYALCPKKTMPASAIVEPFDRDRFLGKWNEVARLSNLFEKDLHNLTDEYLPNEAGTIKVITRAFNPVKNKAVEATGTMAFTGRETRGEPRVAYFPPVCPDCNVLDIDGDCRNALVSGSRMSCLWLISRGSAMPEEIKQRFLPKAISPDFDISRLEWMD